MQFPFYPFRTLWTKPIMKRFFFSICVTQILEFGARARKWKEWPFPSLKLFRGGMLQAQLVFSPAGFLHCSCYSWIVFCMSYLAENYGIQLKISPHGNRNKATKRVKTNRSMHSCTHGRQSWGGWGTRPPPPQFLEWGDEYLIIPPLFDMPV
jgi:hypothetical protein